MEVISSSSAASSNWLRVRKGLRSIEIDSELQGVPFADGGGAASAAAWIGQAEVRAVRQKGFQTFAEGASFVRGVLMGFISLSPRGTCYFSNIYGPNRNFYLFFTRFMPARFALAFAGADDLVLASSSSARSW